MTTLTLDIKKEIQSKNYFVDSFTGKDNRFIHYYLAYLKVFHYQLANRRFNPLKYTIRKAKNELITVNIAISVFEQELNKYKEIRTDNEDYKTIYMFYKKIIIELKNNKHYLENLSTPEINNSLRKSVSNLQLSNFLTD